MDEPILISLADCLLLTSDTGGKFTSPSCVCTTYMYFYNCYNYNVHWLYTHPLAVETCFSETRDKVNKRSVITQFFFSFLVILFLCVTAISTVLERLTSSTFSTVRCSTISDQTRWLWVFLWCRFQSGKAGFTKSQISATTAR